MHTFEWAEQGGREFKDEMDPDNPDADMQKHLDVLTGKETKTRIKAPVIKAFNPTTKVGVKMCQDLKVS